MQPTSPPTPQGTNASHSRPSAACGPCSQRLWSAEYRGFSSAFWALESSTKRQADRQLQTGSKLQHDVRWQESGERAGWNILCPQGGVSAVWRCNCRCKRKRLWQRQRDKHGGKGSRCRGVELPPVPVVGGGTNSRKEQVTRLVQKALCHAPTPLHLLVCGEETANGQRRYRGTENKRLEPTGNNKNGTCRVRQLEKRGSASVEPGVYKWHCQPSTKRKPPGQIQYNGMAGCVQCVCQDGQFNGCVPRIMHQSSKLSETIIIGGCGSHDRHHLMYNSPARSRPILPPRSV